MDRRAASSSLSQRPFRSRMSSSPSKSEVEAKLRQTADAMSDRMASIQDEVTSTGTAVQEWIVRNPVKSVGGMLAAGLLVGWLSGGSTKKRRRQHQKLIDQYLAALTDEVDAATERGESAEQALDKALRDRVPLVVYSQEGGAPQQAGFVRTLLGEGVEILFRTAVSLVARDAISAALANANLDEVMDEL